MKLDHPCWSWPFTVHRLVFVNIEVKRNRWSLHICVQILIQSRYNRRRVLGLIITHLRFPSDHSTDISIRHRIFNREVLLETSQQMNRFSEFLVNFLRSPVPDPSPGQGL